MSPPPARPHLIALKQRAHQPIRTADYSHSSASPSIVLAWDWPRGPLSGGRQRQPDTRLRCRWDRTATCASLSADCNAAVGSGGRRFVLWEGVVAGGCVCVCWG